MNKSLQTLKDRGFFSQCTNVDELSVAMDRGTLTFYVGCDPTGPSLHIGHMVPFFAFRHLIQDGHKGIALIGGGTARIGDPSGKTEMRKMLSYDELDRNAECIKGQLSGFFGGFDGVKADSANNRDWLKDLNYIDFLREIGSHFSVNRMLSFEAYKKRMETGLSFIEFNYQLLQSYDFLQLYRRYGCTLQIGGDDQWGNIVAGMDLIRRLEGQNVPANGITFPLVTTSDGKKMGKTEKGAIFLDQNITSAYDFFQYWRNITDADIKRFLLLFTFLSIEEIEALTAPDKNPNEAKERLAYEVTGIIHGKTAADKALAGAKAAFSGGTTDESAMPGIEMPSSWFADGINIVDLFFNAKLCATKSDARRLVEQGGAFTGKDLSGLSAVTNVKKIIGSADLNETGTLILRAGKKRFCRITLSL